MIVSPTLGWTLLVVFLTPRSAYCGVSATEPVLLPGFGSYSSAFVTLAMLVWAVGIVFTAGAVTRARIVSVLESPEATVPTVQMPVVSLYVP